MYRCDTPGSPPVFTDVACKHPSAIVDLRADTVRPRRAQPDRPPGDAGRSLHSTPTLAADESTANESRTKASSTNHPTCAERSDDLDRLHTQRRRGYRADDEKRLDAQERSLRAFLRRYC